MLRIGSRIIWHPGVISPLLTGNCLSVALLLTSNPSISGAEMKSVLTEIPCRNRPVPRKPKNSDGKQVSGADRWKM